MKLPGSPAADTAREVPKVVIDAGDSQVLKAGQIVTARKLHDENSMLKRKDPLHPRRRRPPTPCPLTSYGRKL